MWRGKRILVALFAAMLWVGVAQAAEPAWVKVAYKTSVKPSLNSLAHKQHALFEFFLDNALHGKGKQDFQQVTEQVKNNIVWRTDDGKNAYDAAFVRSWPFVRNVDLKGMPDTILLIPYMESQWHGKKGRKAADYGYWQLTPEVLKEIQSLDYVDADIKSADINKLRADADLSTRAAQAHLHRYHFYFANVAGFAESDAWLLTFTAFNWGAGNVKRMLADMEADGIQPDFASFYHHLYSTHRKHPGDKSLKAAVEYVPSLWNIAQLIRDSH